MVREWNDIHYGLSSLRKEQNQLRRQIKIDISAGVAGGVEGFTFTQKTKGRRKKQVQTNIAVVNTYIEVSGPNGTFRARVDQEEFPSSSQPPAVSKSPRFVPYIPTVPEYYTKPDQLPTDAIFPPAVNPNYVPEQDEDLFLDEDMRNIVRDVPPPAKKAPPPSPAPFKLVRPAPRPVLIPESRISIINSSYMNWKFKTCLSPDAVDFDLTKFLDSDRDKNFIFVLIPTENDINNISKYIPICYSRGFLDAQISNEAGFQMSATVFGNRENIKQLSLPENKTINVLQFQAQYIMDSDATVFYLVPLSIPKMKIYDILVCTDAEKCRKIITRR